MIDTRCVARLLQVHAEVEHVDDDLRMTLRLHRAAHESEADQWLAVLHNKGRNDRENAVVKVCNGTYQGFGYIDKEDVDNQVLLNACIKPYADNKDVQVIIKGFLRKYPETKVLGVRC